MDSRKLRPFKLGRVDIAISRGYIVEEDGLYKCTLCQANDQASRGEWKKREAIRQHEKKVIHRRLVELIEEKMSSAEIGEDMEDGEDFEEVNAAGEAEVEEPEDLKENQDRMDIHQGEAYEGLDGKLDPSFDSPSWSSEESMGPGTPVAYKFGDIESVDSSWPEKTTLDYRAWSSSLEMDKILDQVYGGTSEELGWASDTSNCCQKADALIDACMYTLHTPYNAPRCIWCQLPEPFLGAPRMCEALRELVSGSKCVPWLNDDALGRLLEEKSPPMGASLDGRI
ncbi:hypothetical protein BDV93DRAFT_604105 [Ceratobasidium sp. AG-I]|nr:hypothetical protein BDV93DRAFT_604105 [Ceratobasidium sp. AG-I]